MSTIKRKTSAMDSFKIKTAESVNGSSLTEPRGKIAQVKIAEILKQYNCELICSPRTMYGQTIYVPVVNELPEKGPFKNENVTAKTT